MKQDFIKFPFFLTVRPFQAFWDLKFEGRGKRRVAAVVLFLLVLNVTLQQQFAGFLVNYADPRYLNSLKDIAYTILPFFLFCIANWAITTLMDGEGTFTQIVLSTAYALTPLVVINLPLTFISRYITQEEVAFYVLINGIATVWFLFLLFVGNMTVHQYTAGKTVVTLLLTVIAMGIAVFLATLAYSMGMQIYWFIYDVYRELIFR
jgi:hypothetical protein